MTIIFLDEIKNKFVRDEVIQTMKQFIDYIIGMILLVFGVVVIAIIDVLTPASKSKWKYLDHIYGNRIDSIDGDAAYRAKVPNKKLRRYRWCALRNPINNYLRNKGINGNLSSLRTDGIGHNGTRLKRLVTRTIWMEDNSKYTLRELQVFSKLYLYWGYMILEDWRPTVNSKFEKGHHFENRLMLSPLRFKPLPWTDENVL